MPCEHYKDALTEAAATGRLRYPVSMAGDYVVVIDNQEDQPAEAHVQVSLDFGPQPAPTAARASSWPYTSG